MYDDMKRALEAAEAAAVKAVSALPDDMRVKDARPHAVAAAIAAFHRDMERQADAAGEMATAGMHASMADAVERAAKEGA